MLTITKHSYSQKWLQHLKHKTCHLESPVVATPVFYIIVHGWR